MFLNNRADLEPQLSQAWNTIAKLQNRKEELQQEVNHVRSEVKVQQEVAEEERRKRIESQEMAEELQEELKRLVTTKKFLANFLKTRSILVGNQIV